ncbi:MAG: hypothetical protein JWL76_1416 [Thermoleophilia bacterium]|nr:hypothetical protein [Thermoleophilia bacterium]
MMMLTGVSPSPVQVPPNVGVPPAGPTTAPPSPPTLPPTKTLTGVSANFVVDLTESSRLAAKAVEMLGTVPLDDVGSEATKDIRIRVFKTNMAVQKRLEKQLNETNPEAVVSELRKADAYLEDANWQLAKKPSPDGRFNGVDIPGAVRDTAEGARIIDSLLTAAGGEPSTPSTPPPVNPPGGPVEPPSGPSFPPSTPGGPLPPTWPPVPGGGGGGEEPDLPPAPPSDPDLPPAPPAGPTPPNGGSPDSDYPGEDEFPKDEDILKGGDS